MLGDQIRYKRLQMELTLTEISHRSGISKSYLSSIERNIQQNPSLIILQRICSALDLDLFSLLNESPNYSVLKLKGENILNEGNEAITVDKEWVQLIAEAKIVGLTLDEVQQFLIQQSLKKDV
ncbi:helix-turn-helix domain-containing protein [Bacillus kexueae]|uniref:helix-turn-helix domain-containing protein n=1 Tax=Aeribacillus kexueae TaxID=2078952 RepID=UPI001FB026CA|nr:helix-turn-helix domain-containing protein [Bacillus kexueae]